jgi:sugar phosphate isomerase/epimerase
MPITRRAFHKLALTGLAFPRLAHAAIDSVVGGVPVGVQTYSFRDLPRPEGGDASSAIIQAIVACGLGECEVWAPQLEPRFPSGRRGSAQAQKSREDLRRWRLDTSLDHFANVRKRFDAAGIAVYAYNYSFGRDFTDEEIDRGFEMARALGAEIVTASTTIDVARRVAPFAEKHRMVVAMHGHSSTAPDELASPESFAAVMKMSRYFKVNLDIGHFTAANFDAVGYIREHHADITNLHLKDRRKNQGENTPWGEGDTPIREVLQLLKRERWPIRAYIEYEHRGEGSPVEEVSKCYAFVRRALA